MLPWGTLKSKKFMVRFGIGFVAAFVAFGALAAFECCWLTRAERNSAQAALVAIDGLQDFNSLSDDDFDARVQDVQNAVVTARQAAATIRDQQVAFALVRYLSSIEIERNVSRRQQQSDSLGEQELRSDAALHMGQNGIVRSLSSSLHQTLD
jgi:hypothetical protein